jgi:flagellar assembly protein FliH
MSADAGFSTMAFPRLRIAQQERIDEQVIARGHAAGYAEGLRAAALEEEARAARRDTEHAIVLRHAQAKIDRVLELLNAAALALDARAAPVLRESGAALVATAVQLAEAIVGAELRDSETSAQRALARALEHADSGEVHTVRMHPDDLALLEGATASLVGVRFSADPSLARGDAVSEFPEGYLDARIGTALLRVKTTLVGAP